MFAFFNTRTAFRLLTDIQLFSGTDITVITLHYIHFKDVLGGDQEFVMLPNQRWGVTPPDNSCPDNLAS